MLAFQNNKNNTTFRFSSLVYGTSLILDTQNAEISGFSNAYGYKYKTRQQAKMTAKAEKKNPQSNFVPEKH